jgi:hypothetical protein
MTPELRLDRVERIAKLFARVGLRERRRQREQDEKINIVLNWQVGNEERFAKLAEAHTRLEDALSELAESQAHSDRRLDALIDMFREWRNGRDATQH